MNINLVAAQLIIKNRFLLLKNTRNLYSGAVLCINGQRNIRLDYEVVSINSKHYDETPIVISHGLFGSKINWRSLSKRMNAMSGRKVITYDIVNHGSSPHHPEMSYNNIAHDLISLLNRLDIQKAILLGHSMGGKAVMTAALEHPDRVEKLIVIDVSPSISKSMGEVASYMKVMANMKKMKSREDVENELSNVVKSSSVLQFLMTNLVSKNKELYWRINLDAMMKNYHYIHSFPDFPDHISYNGPTLFIAGGRSYYITEEDYPKIYSRFPSAKIKIIQDAGHWVHSENPSEFLNCISDYIRVD